MDEADLAFQASCVPADCIPQGFVAVFSFINPEGGQMWKTYAQIDLPVSATVGLLEMAKLDMIARSETGLPINYGYDIGEEDDA